MWTIIKFDKKRLPLVKSEFRDRLGSDVYFYEPKLRVVNYSKSKKIIKDISILGDYLLCFHRDFAKQTAISSLKYSRGLKYFLTNYFNSQKDIEKFVNHCKSSEDENGFLKYSYFNFKDKNKFEFLSGPFKNFVFTAIEQNKLYLTSLIGRYQIIVSKKNNLIRPI